MILYQFPEEREFIVFFSEKLGEKDIPELLDKSLSLGESEAKRISLFFWKMIDLAVELQNNGECPWPEGYEFWCEKVLQSITAFLKKSGYGNILNEVSAE